METPSAAVAPGYCPKCNLIQERTVFTMTEQGWLWGSRCPVDGTEMRSRLLDLVGVTYHDPSEVSR